MNPIEAWTVGRLLVGINGGCSTDALSDSVRRAIEKAESLDVDQRESYLTGFIDAGPEPEKTLQLIASIDPSGEPPAVAPRVRPASLADIRSQKSNEPWLWKGFIPAARIGGIGAYEGVGKTRFAMDLARRIWFGLSWPDGQEATLPEGTPSLWVCSDGQQDDLLSIAEAYGMPDESLFFNTTPDQPYGGTELDAKEDLDRLEQFIDEVKPGLVFIDTVTNATNYDLTRATENKGFMTPLRDIAQRRKVTIIPLVHLSKEGHALGRRIKGLLRTIIQLECPESTNPSRLRLWVQKSFDKIPPELGVTMGDKGNDYDNSPPRPNETKKTGRPAEAREKAIAFIVEALTGSNDQIGNDLCSEYEKEGGNDKTFWRAVKDLENGGRLTRDGGTGTGKQVVLHLIREEMTNPPG